MPAPLSATRTHTREPFGLMSTDTAPPCGVCCTAFCSRLTTSRRNSSSSPAHRTSDRPGRRHRDAALRGQHVRPRAGTASTTSSRYKSTRAKRIAAGVGAREHQHVVDERAQPPRLRADHRERLAILGFVAMLAAERRRRRRVRMIDTGVAQLVRGVGHELPLRLQRRAEPRHQRR